MAGLGATFVAQGRANGVDPAFLVAICGAETDFGQLLYQQNGDVATYNAFNWFSGPTWPQSDFASWGDAISAEAAGLAGSLYYGAGLYSVQDIAPRYCPDGTDAWVSNVTTFLTELGGNAADTRLAQSYGQPAAQPGLLQLHGAVTVSSHHFTVGRMATVRFTVTNGGGSPLHSTASPWRRAARAARKWIWPRASPSRWRPAPRAPSWRAGGWIRWAAGTAGSRSSSRGS